MMERRMICFVFLAVSIQGFQFSDFFYGQKNANPSSEATASKDFTEIVGSYSYTNDSTEQTAKDANSISSSITNDSKTGTHQENGVTEQYSPELRIQKESTKNRISSENVEISRESFENNSETSMSIPSGINTEDIITSSGNNTEDMSQSSFIPTAATEANGSSTQQDEEEKVVIGKPFLSENTTSNKEKKTIYFKAVEFISDTYTLSILLPVAAGVIFASTIIVTIAACRWVRRKCRHNRMRRKALPDSVKHLRPSDRARLLAESSDDEF